MQNKLCFFTFFCLALAAAFFGKVNGDDLQKHNYTQPWATAKEVAASEKSWTIPFSFLIISFSFIEVDDSVLNAYEQIHTYVCVCINRYPSMYMNISVLRLFSMSVSSGQFLITKALCACSQC